MKQDMDPTTDPKIETGDGAPGNGAAPIIPEDSHYADVRPLLFGDLWDYAPAPESPDHVKFEKRYGRDRCRNISMISARCSTTGRK